MQVLEGQEFRCALLGLARESTCSPGGDIHITGVKSDTTCAHLSSPCLPQGLRISSQGSGAGMPTSQFVNARVCKNLSHALHCLQASEVLLCHYWSHFTDLTELNLTALTQSFLEMQGSIRRLRLLLCHLPFAHWSVSKDRVSPTLLRELCQDGFPWHRVSNYAFGKQFLWGKFPLKQSDGVKCSLDI